MAMPATFNTPPTLLCNEYEQFGITSYLKNKQHTQKKIKWRENYWQARSSKRWEFLNHFQCYSKTD